MVTLASKQLNYAQAYGPQLTISYPLAASVAFKYLGGKFVTLDANERITLSGSGDDPIKGWAYAGEFTSSATAGDEFITVNDSREARYWIPADAAVTRDLIEKTCDLIVNNGIQQADVGESNEDVLLIHDVDITLQAVLVSIVDPGHALTGVV